MNISKSRLVQIIKEEIDILEAEKKELQMSASNYEKDNSKSRPMLTLEEQEMLSEMDW